MFNCIFVSDLHGKTERYLKLFEFILSDSPDIIFIGGDLLPSAHGYYNGGETGRENFIEDFLKKNLAELKMKLAEKYPEIFVIMGNDDAKIEEPLFLQVEKDGLCHYINEKHIKCGDYKIFGYSYVPPTPFLLKDWEKYDVSRYVDPGSISPEEGSRTVRVSKSEMRYSTIKDDLDKLTSGHDMNKSIFLFHSPPYKTQLDRAALDGKMIDHVSLDVHVGSIAIKKFIEERQPMLTLHGHVHESARLTGNWKDKLNNTFCFNAAYDGNELSLIKFKLEKIEQAERLLL